MTRDIHVLARQAEGLRARRNKLRAEQARRESGEAPQLGRDKRACMGSPGEVPVDPALHGGPGDGRRLR